MPMVIIKLKEGNGFPEMVRAGKASATAAATASLSALTAPSPMPACLSRKAHRSSRNWRSARNSRAVSPLPPLRALFQEAARGKEKLQRLIEIARYAPSGGNLQLVEWMVFTEAHGIKEIAGLTVDGCARSWQRPPIGSPYFPLIIGAWTWDTIP